jgi:hypothetical protein
MFVETARHRSDIPYNLQQPITRRNDDAVQETPERLPGRVTMLILLEQDSLLLDPAKPGLVSQ